MKSWTLTRFGGPDEAFQMTEGPDPQPKAGEVQIQVEASGINFADYQARAGLYRECPPLPCVIGYEVVGRVSALGEGVTHVPPGQRVLAFTFFGGYASVVCAQKDGVVAIPDELPPAEAAALAVQGATAWYMTEDTIRLHPGQHVLVQAAAGGVGLILVQLAKARGCVVYGTASSDAKLDYLRSIGVDHPINYAREDFGDAVRKIRGTEHGLDVIYDSLGGSYFSKGMGLLGPGGKLLAFGGAAGSSEKGELLKTLKLATGFGIFSPIPWLMKSKGFLGVNMLKIALDNPQTLKRCLEGVVGRWKEGKLKLHTGGVYPAEKLADAHRAIGGRGTIGKLVIEWRK